ncbi:RapZ C-terminal domain-containing protein [Ancylomarina longa]|uniref:Phosphotransferase enzyme family protein n=1 Tax=Ancylomarina longa TaxID=2487017 RepID=A0A434AUS9_9BACT|nr:RNase adapter RapZ [Ancylomarina longa]RUT78193.1 phosphotransferase enzyme family protein [Ancylomarina longa]
MKQEIKNALIQLFESWADDKVVETELLPQSGSYREYIRLIGQKRIVLGAFNEDKKENHAFVSFSNHFASKGLPVPKIYHQNEAQNMYLLQDLGNTTLFDYILNLRVGEGFANDLIVIYKKIINQLVRFQIEGREGLDYSACYPRDSFDKQSMIWDLHYFKYYFLKLAKIPFDEQLLENDYQNFTDYLLEAPRDYFLYRDFQSRNIMLVNGEPWFIDYQGGRKGALQYDLASLLYDAKADLPQEVRDELLEYYIQEVQKVQAVDVDAFRSFFHGYVLIRIMQAMGAYGFRGFYERKEHFLKSIPFALQNLNIILSRLNLPVELPELTMVLNAVLQSDFLKQVGQKEKIKLHVEINSFSYRRGIPLDKTTNGGGFVFDCRAIHNPGRYPEYVEMTGKDQSVIDFFKERSEMDDFLQSVYAIVDMSVNKYIKRNFHDLQVSFGCTGGRHRSVFSAESLAKHLREKFDVNISLRHIEREIEGE